ncbi:MAG TPA: SWIM zinc finger family protein [Chloroflexota bacterium]|nr:SWIM zinc finger family protein [Chloroflexota bacterium]
MSTRTYCESCGTFRFKPAGEPCFHCKPAAEKRALATERVACTVCGEAFARHHRSNLGAGPICPVCVEDGRWKEAAPAISPAPQIVESDTLSDSPVTFGGHQVDAPGYTSDQFERAICRALVVQLEIHAVNGSHVVSHPGLTGGYKVTRTSCTCKAGEVGTPCKHRAALIFHLDVREPAIREQWADVRKAVAA